MTALDCALQRNNRACADFLRQRGTAPASRITNQAALKIQRRFRRTKTITSDTDSTVAASLAPLTQLTIPSTPPVDADVAQLESVEETLRAGRSVGYDDAMLYSVVGEEAARDYKEQLRAISPSESG